MSIDHDALTAHFDPREIRWRKGGGNGKYLAYIDARHVMSRLDEVVGWDGWEDRYHETPSGRVICTLTVNGVTKSDGAGDTSFEGEKGAISDAFKRAAVKFGIGRYLYSLPPLDDPVKGFALLEKLISGFPNKAAKTRVRNAMLKAAQENSKADLENTTKDLTNDQKAELWDSFNHDQRRLLEECRKGEDNG